MNKEKELLPNEAAAEFVTNIEGWVCKTCRVFYGKDGEKSARYCCEKDHACGNEECKGRAEKAYIYCDPCRSRMDLDRYMKLEAVEWDGETPLVVYHDDTYFFDIGDLSDWLAEHGLKAEDAQLVLAEEDSPPLFEMNEFLCDYLCEDNRDELDAGKIDKTVNRWIEKNAPVTWVPSNKRPSEESMRRHIPQSEKSEG